VVCHVQHKSNKARPFNGVQGTSSGVDLMIVDIPEGLPIPIVSSPLTSVPVWNSTDESFLPLVFDFGSSLVHDNGTLLLFHKDDLKLRADIRGYVNAYHFKILKEWTGINRLPLTSARDASKTVSGSSLVMCFILLNRSIYDFHIAHHLPYYILLQTLKFYIQLLVRSYQKVPSSTFSIRPMAELDSVGIDVAVDDVLFNLVTKDTQLMRGSMSQHRIEYFPTMFQILL
jgi:hypothetical protein